MTPGPEGGHAIGSWSDFFVTSATAAATVLGLLFVAVQFNLERFPSGQPATWLATARSTWIIFASLFFEALVYLIPGLGSGGRLIGTALIVIISGRRIVAAWLPVRTAVAERRGTALKRTLWVMVAPLALYVALLAHAVALAWGLQVQSGIAYIFMGLFGIALRNSWDLLVELHVFPLSSTRKDP